MPLKRAHYVRSLGNILALIDKPYFTALLRRCTLDVVAQTVRHQIVDYSVLLYLLDTLEAWGSQTYEGNRIAAAIGIDPRPRPSAISSVHVTEFLDQDYAKLLWTRFAASAVTFRTLGEPGSV